VNGPPTFIAFIHDLDSTWKDLARSFGVTIDEDTNTNIIVDDILSFAKSLAIALLYMECQLKVAQSQNLSLSLRKSHIFPPRFEFVGIDVCPEGNRPAMSKHQLLTHWEPPQIVQDVAKFVGFIQFYSRFIPNFEVRISPLLDIMLKDYTKPVGDMWTPAANAAFDEMKKAILDDPCLRPLAIRSSKITNIAYGLLGGRFRICSPSTRRRRTISRRYAQMHARRGLQFYDEDVVLHPPSCRIRMPSDTGQREAAALPLGRRFLRRLEYQ
jgi:hypothetical protein